MKEAKDHSRVSKEGKAIGATTAQIADKTCAALAKMGEPDERCKTCAFTAGTVPNGCLQTQMDVLKAITDAVPFMCHQHHDKFGSPIRVCHGWYSLRWAIRQVEKSTGETLPKTPWEFSHAHTETT